MASRDHAQTAGDGDGSLPVPPDSVAKPLKAYHVNDHGEGYGGIVFARFNAEARRIGASIYGDGDWDSVECRRSPGFDHLTPGPVSNADLWEMGWWFECDICNGHAIASDGGVEIAGVFYCENHNPAIQVGRLLAAFLSDDGASSASTTDGNRAPGMNKNQSSGSTKNQ